MNDAALAKTGFSDVAQQLREKIQSEFVNLIPQEAWDQMLKTEVLRFTQDTHSKDYNGRVTTTPSEFSSICQGHLTDLVKAEVGKRFGEMGVEQVRELVGTWLENNTQRVLKTFVEDLFRVGMQAIVSELSGTISFRLREFINNKGF